MSIYSEFNGFGDSPRPAWTGLNTWFQQTPAEILQAKQEQARLAFFREGITFSLAGDASGVERAIPFDILPRVLTQSEWQYLSRGLAQRVQALNLFLQDVYNDQRILRDGIIPSEVILGNSQY